MPSPGWIPAVLASCLVAVVVCYPLTTDSNCTCYQTNETASQFLTHHKFFDFRSLPQYVNVPKAIDDPALSAGADVTSSYFSTADWQSWWQIQSWNNSDTLQRGNQTNATISDATVFMVNSPSNIYFERNTDARPASQTYLTMRTARHTTFQSAAEFESVALDYRYLSVRMKARTKGPPGAITAMFTYRAAQDMNKVQEADLEVRTADPRSSIQYTNQPSWNDNGDVPGSTQNISDPRHVDWGSWQVHRMDWTPKASNWFVNGKLVRSLPLPLYPIACSVCPRSQIRAKLVYTFNAHSCRLYPSRFPEMAARSSSTRGAMAAPGVAIVSIALVTIQSQHHRSGPRQLTPILTAYILPVSLFTEAYLQVQWIDIVYNNTIKASPGQPLPGWPFPGQPSTSCKNVCSIDETSVIGTPVLITTPGK